MKAVVWIDALQGIIYVGGVLLVMSIVSLCLFSSKIRYILVLFGQLVFKANEHYNHERQKLTLRWRKETKVAPVIKISV